MKIPEWSTMSPSDLSNREIDRNILPESIGKWEKTDRGIEIIHEKTIRSIYNVFFPDRADYVICPSESRKTCFTSIELSFHA